MSMFNTGDILETIEMFTQDNLDVRTVTMGISLLDCIDPDPKKACEKDRKSTRLNSSHTDSSRMPSSA